MGINRQQNRSLPESTSRNVCPTNTLFIHFTADDLVNMRFAYSSMLELVKSYHRLNNRKIGGLHKRWMEEARRNLYGVEFTYLNAVLTSSNYVPDFLTPPPLASTSKLENEFERLQNLPADLIRRNILRLMEYGVDSEILRQFLAYPHEALFCLLEEMRLYWQRTLAHHWPRMMSVIESDILYRGRQLALEGSSALFASLYPNAAFQAGPLTLEFEGRGRYVQTEYELNGQGLQLVPSIFSGWISWQIEPEWQPMLIYSPRGTGLWYEPPSPAPDQSLEIALGEGRARVLRLLITPASTGEIARRLQITAGAASQHLSRLNQAGLVEPRRSGRRVYYYLTQRGEQLLALFS